MNQQVIVGYFIKTVYHNYQSGYTVARFLLKDALDSEIVVVGVTPKIIDELAYELTGEYFEHPKFGWQFQITGINPYLVSEKSAIISFLSSAFFIGIGTVVAGRIYDHFGSETLTILQADVNQIETVSGLSNKQKQAVIAGLNKTNDLLEAYELFSLLGLNPQLIYIITKIFGQAASEIIKENPYRLAFEVEGIGFKTADKIAMKLNFPLDHPYRLEAALTSLALELCFRSGNTFINEKQLEGAFHAEFPEFDFAYYLASVLKQGLLVMEEDRIFHQSQYQAEITISRFFQGFPFSPLAAVKLDELTKQIDALSEKYNISYDQSQKQALSTLFLKDVMIVTGGPGTGKTTMVKAMVNLFQMLYPTESVVLCAPTGRAAKRLTELTAAPASTIHSLLGFDLETNRFRKNETDPLAISLLIIDEFSMVDNWLFASLLKACSQVKKIVIIGDDNQLPSVLPGNVLSDLILAQLFPVIRLTTIYRQKKGSGVIELAHQIKNGQVADLSTFSDVKFYTVEYHELKQQLTQVVKEIFTLGYNLDEFIVLAPRYHYNLGIDDLNVLLQNVCNPASAAKQELNYGLRVFREQDKVMQLKNQPDDDIYNGDIGFIVEINNLGTTEVNLIVDFDGNFVSYTPENLANLTHAYCVSIHKAQGSEYPIVIMPIIKAHLFMLNRQLLYTGVSRAKQELILLGNPAIFYHAAAKAVRQTRQSGLISRLQAVT